MSISTVQRSSAQRMAERDELVRALGRHDARDDRGIEHRALLRAMTAVAQFAAPPPAAA